MPKIKKDSQVASKERIVLYVSSFPKLSETFVINHFAELLSGGWDAHIVCSKHNLKERNEIKNSLINENQDRIHEMWPCHPRILAVVLFPAVLLKCLTRNFLGTIFYLKKGCELFGLSIIKKFYIDAEIICLRPKIIHFEFGALAVGKMYLKDLIRCKVVVSFRGYDINHSGVNQPNYYQSVWENVDAIHCLGQYIWERVVSRGCPKEKPHRLIPPAVDLKLFSGVDRNESERVGVQSRPLRLLSVGRLEWKKGYDYSFRAAQILKEQGINFEYRVVGDGNDRGAVSFARHQMGLDDTVQLLGALPASEVHKLLKWADIFVHSAVSEGFCNAVLEAQAMGLPVVTSDAGGLAENVEDGTTGYVVPRRTPEALADKIQVLINDSALRKRMGQAGRKRVEHKFQLKKQIDSFEELYQAVSR